jgi:hypothetical protein
MVIVCGVVRDAKLTTDTSTYYITGASIEYGNITTSSVDGFFSISSDVVSSTIVATTKDKYAASTMDIISFGTKYDPNTRLSGTVLDSTSVSGVVGITQLTVTISDMVPNTLVSSRITVTGGADSGQTCYVISNTKNSFRIKF